MKVMKKQLLIQLCIVLLIFIMVACVKGNDDPNINRDNTCSLLEFGGKKYKTVKIGSQCWMAENFEYNAGSGSWEIPFPELASYGWLYNFSAATRAAPEGWHLPTLEEWDQLAQYISDQHGGYGSKREDYEWPGVGKHLKDSKERGAFFLNGTDDYGFRAFPAGQRSVELSLGTSSYDPRKQYAFFWTSTQQEDGSVRMIMLKANSDSFYTTWINKERLAGDAVSVRYVKD
jgi:uncharacterized protein (TIGR02145 family)